MTDPLYRKARKFAHLTAGGNLIRNVGDEGAYLHSITINTGAAGTITVYNNGDAAGDPVAVITVAAGDNFTLHYGLRCSVGLYVQLSVTMDITVVYE